MHHPSIKKSSGQRPKGAKFSGNFLPIPYACPFLIPLSEKQQVPCWKRQAKKVRMKWKAAFATGDGKGFLVACADALQKILHFFLCGIGM